VTWFGVNCSCRKCGRDCPEFLLQAPFAAAVWQCGSLYSLPDFPGDHSELEQVGAYPVMSG
jgi:hypothetical protein